jgi:hypothetical protein
VPPIIAAHSGPRNAPAERVVSQFEIGAWGRKFEERRGSGMIIYVSTYNLMLDRWWEAFMNPRLNIGSWRVFSMFLGCVVAIGILVELSTKHPLLNMFSVVLWFVLVIITSSGIFIRMWRRRHNPVEFWKASHRHSGELSVLSAKWRRGVVRKDD